MSKIALQADPSGTGIFTIASPNSNTNRTITLPDAGGEVLTDSQNNAAKLFRRDNILGTVSESGGVPTGAIIEQGSNATGRFIRYADGTQICWIYNIGNLTTTASTGNIFTSTGFGTWTYPAVFSESPSITASALAASNEVKWAMISTTSTTSVLYRQMSSGTSAVARGTSLIALGRWY